MKDHFYLLREMRETPALVRGFDFTIGRDAAEAVARKGRLVISGEGSSRILPAHAAISLAMRHGMNEGIVTMASYQAAACDLSNSAVMAASNSGRTKETLALIRALVAAGRKDVWGITADGASPIAKESPHSVVLRCGPEAAVAATKSVVEQALVYMAVIDQRMNLGLAARATAAADAMDAIFASEIDPAIVKAIATSRAFFWAGENTGAAEELALKTNEITRKSSVFLEGTLALHGPEEVMRENDTIVFVEPYANEFETMKKIFVDEVKCNIVCISSQETPFPTIRIPKVDDFEPLVQLVAGWHLLSAAGLALGIDLDHPARARKIGNEAK